jgi:hypothetical protein
MELGLYFVLSQIAMFIATAFDFLGMQFKKREHLFLCLIISACFISAHYFFLNKIAAGVIMLLSAVRFITCYHSSDKRYIYIFIALNTVSLLFTYVSPYDFICYVGINVLIIGNFQEDNRRMRIIMMLGTAVMMFYNAIIYSPMGVISTASFIISNMIGYYRHYIRKDNTSRNKDKKK